MNRQKAGALFFVLALTASLGFGCSRAQDSGEVALEKLSPEEVNKRMTFKENSNFVIDQAAFEYQGSLGQGPMGLSMRKVIIEEFSGEGATFRWSQEMSVETEESIAARQAFEKEHPDETGGPAPVYEVKQNEGAMDSIIFQETHKLYLPVRWQEGRAGDRSGVLWVSKDVYQELSRTRNSTVYINVIATLLEIAQRHPELADAVEAFRKEEAEASQKQDTDLMKVEGDHIDYPIRVDGKDVKVKAIRARNWYGEMIVLDNYDNPLVLKFDFIPPVEGLDGATSEMNLFKDLLSYEITAVLLEQ